MGWGERGEGNNCDPAGWWEGGKGDGNKVIGGGVR